MGIVIKIFLFESTLRGFFNPLQTGASSEPFHGVETSDRLRILYRMTTKNLKNQDYYDEARGINCNTDIFWVFLSIT